MRFLEGNVLSSLCCFPYLESLKILWFQHPCNGQYLVSRLMKHCLFLMMRNFWINVNEMSHIIWLQATWQCFWWFTTEQKDELLRSACFCLKYFSNKSINFFSDDNYYDECILGDALCFPWYKPKIRLEHVYSVRTWDLSCQPDI